MVYARSRFAKRIAGSYRRNRFGTRFTSTMAYRKKTKYNRRLTKYAEKKYWDRTRVYEIWEQYSIDYMRAGGSSKLGAKFTSSGHASGLLTEALSANLLRGLATGTTVSKRIGNKINVKYMKIGVTLQAAVSPAPMGGEVQNDETPVVPLAEYMKTHFRIVLVKDLQVNDPSQVVKWADVFGVGEGGDDSFETACFGANDNLQIGNMGRFRILKDFKCQLDADDPMKAFNFYANDIGEVRYNGDTNLALPNHGYYLLIAQDVMGTATTTDRVRPGVLNASVRICFSDQ